MTVEQFFAKYANTPLNKRFIDINDGISLDMIFGRIRDLEETMRPMRIEEDRLIKIAELVL